ncbi:MAG: 5-bromo-4-chloroindolyl phosphate hydrolysis family protein, partial [Rhodobacterales bacterium]|nr:5-bromo-4-chloroindolyl phosphate hydrolysis family protein [Rhodobacterales bacterium]
MARRYSGPHSPRPTPGATPPPPDAPPPLRSARPTRVGARVNMLFLAPLPLAIRAFQSEPGVMAGTLGGLGLLLAAAWLTREGLIAEEAYEARTVARRPAIPRKIFASVLTGAGLGLGSLPTAADPLAPVVFALAGAVLHSLAFGLDPLRDKGAEGIDPLHADRVARAVDEAEKTLAAMADAIARAQDRALQDRVDRLAAAARRLFRTIEADPRDLTAARKDIGVFLRGARDATVKFADLWTRNRDAAARADYERLLADLEAHFDRRAQAGDGVFDDRAELNALGQAHRVVGHAFDAAIG